MIKEEWRRHCECWFLERGTTWLTVASNDGWFSIEEPTRSLRNCLGCWCIGRRYAGMGLRQIGEAIGDLSYPAVSDAVRRTTARLEKDRSLQKRLKQVLHYLNL